MCIDLKEVTERKVQAKKNLKKGLSSIEGDAEGKNYNLGNINAIKQESILLLHH